MFARWVLYHWAMSPTLLSFFKYHYSTWSLNFIYSLNISPFAILTYSNGFILVGTQYVCWTVERNWIHALWTCIGIYFSKGKSSFHQVLWRVPGERTLQLLGTIFSHVRSGKPLNCVTYLEVISIEKPILKTYPLNKDHPNYGFVVPCLY